MNALSLLDPCIYLHQSRTTFFTFELIQFTNSSTVDLGILHKIVIFDDELLYLLLCTYVRRFLQVYKLHKNL